MARSKGDLSSLCIRSLSRTPYSHISPALRHELRFAVPVPVDGGGGCRFVTCLLYLMPLRRERLGRLWTQRIRVPKWTRTAPLAPSKTGDSGSLLSRR